MKFSAAFKIERRFNVACTTLRRRIAAKVRMHLQGSLIKLNRIREILMHRRFLWIFYKIIKISLATYENM